MNAFDGGCRHTGNHKKMSFHTRKTPHIKTHPRQVEFTMCAEEFQQKYELADALLRTIGISISGLNASN